MNASTTPLVSVLLAVHDDARYVGTAIESILRQSVADLELVVVDDASTDATPDLLASLSDRRVVVLRNDEQLGLAASLNRALDLARGRYVARLDADDIALQDRLERQLARIERDPRVGIVGTAVVDIDESGHPGRVHRLPGGATAVRWHALFSAPFFHPTVLFARALLDEHDLRYDSAYLESEDFDLWTRLFAFADGDNLQEPLLLKRVHPGQATVRRGELQTSFQEQIALREIGRVAPALAAEDAELAWRLGSGGTVPAPDLSRAADAYLALLEAFERRHGRDRPVRRAVARRLARAGLAGRALTLAPDLPVRFGVERSARPFRDRAARRRVSSWLAALERTEGALRVTVVSPEPTPYRAPLFDRLAADPNLELTVVYASSTVARRAWSVELHHPALFLRGVSVPGLRGIFRHDYPVTPGIAHALREARAEVVVVSGWSTFAAQVALAWCRRHRIPYVLLVESHDVGPRARWRRLVKRTAVPPIVRGASAVLVVGSLARESVVARGAAAERVRVFANTIDVERWKERAERLSRQRAELRAALGVEADAMVVLSVGRLVPEKGHEQLLRAVAQTSDPHQLLVIAGSGRDERKLTRLASDLGVRLVLTGELSEERLAEVYAGADVFALLSEHEPWGVVVNEAAASGLPLVLSERVGAARDLLRDGENGFLVQAGDVGGAAAALTRLAGDSELRATMGARSRELLADWGYEPSVESFVAAVREAAKR